MLLVHVICFLFDARFIRSQGLHITKVRRNIWKTNKNQCIDGQLVPPNVQTYSFAGLKH